MSQLKLDDAVARVKSNTQGERAEGLTDVIHILNHNRSKARSNAFTIRSFYLICDALFQCASVDRKIFANPKNKTASDKAEKRLQLCGDALRLTIELGVQRMSLKIFGPILQHIVETLPMPGGGGFCEPLVGPYLKCLLSALEYQPHLEHLSTHVWSTTVDFCIEGFSYSEETESIGSRLTIPQSGSRRRDTSIDSFARSATREPRERIHHDEVTATSAQEFVMCLKLLLQVPNAPVLDKASQCLDALIGFLLHTRVARAHLDAITTINLIFTLLHLQNNNVLQEAFRRYLPAIKEIWMQSKLSSVLREDLLATLVLGQEHISAMLMSDEDSFQPHELESLLECLHVEYVRRMPREQLQIDQLRFHYTESFSQYSHLTTPAFSLDPLSSAEEPWMVLNLIGTFTLLLDRKRAKVEESKHSDDNERPIKRMRYTSHTKTHLEELQSSKPFVKIYALQILAFTVYRMPIDDETLKIILDKLIVCVSDKSVSVAGWALLCIASVAFCDACTSPTLSAQWQHIWEQAARSVVVVPSCRAACLVMQVLLDLKLVPYSSLVPIVESMYASLDLSGPAVLADSSLSLLSSIIHYGSLANPSRFERLSDRTVQWIFTRWTLGFIGETPYGAQVKQHFIAADVLRSFSSSLDRTFDTKVEQCVVLGPIGKASLFIHEHHEKAAYILLLDDTAIFRQPREPQQKSSATSERIPNSVVAIEALIIEACSSHIEDSSRQFHDWLSERPQSITKALISSTATLTIVASAVGRHSHPSNSAKAKSLVNKTDTLIKVLVDTACASESDTIKLDALLETLALTLPAIESLKSLESEIFTRFGISSIALQLIHTLDSRHNTLTNSVPVSDFDDFMELDGDIGSQPIPEGAYKQLTDIPRTESRARTDPASLKYSTLAYLRFVNSIRVSVESNENLEAIPPSFIDHFATLPPLELSYSRVFLDRLLQTSLQLQVPEAELLLAHIAESLLGPYEFNNSESALCFGLDILSKLAPLWTDKELELLHDSGTELYEYFMKEPFQLESLSYRVQVSASNLFKTLYMIDEKFGDESNLPSARTGLFGLLGQGMVLTKFHIADNLPSIFQHFVLSEHEFIMNDIVQKLPIDEEWVEGMALRLAILAKLASTWHTLLRKGVYHIFEVAGMVPSCIDHATICVQQISQAINLDHPNSLFTMFAPQLLYTWIDDSQDQGTSQPLNAIPFAIFKYKSLAELLEDIKDEAFSQVLMRGNSDEVQYLTATLKTDDKDIIEKTFSKVVAYTMSYDTDTIAINKRSMPSREKAVSEILGTPKYLSLVRLHFTKILGVLFQTAADAKDVERKVTSFPYFEKARNVHKEITSICQSTNKLPPDQQPSFAGSTLYQRIDRLCRRAKYKPEAFWTTDKFVFVLRMLLSGLTPTLGSLHSCSVIRKIRILISIAGDSALEGYALQMCLHSLCPFLTDTYCADDTLGIVQYLFLRGRQELTSHFTFVAGTGLSTLVSLRSFLGSTQESTTQESHHLATISKATKFHSWLSNYLLEFGKLVEETPIENKPNIEAIHAFSSIIQAAKEVRVEGSAVQNTDESALLLALLKNDVSEHKVLSRQSQDLAFSLLGKNFKYSTRSSENILGSDQDAKAFAGAVWRSCQYQHITNEYLLWAARVLGRAFCSKGELKIALKKGDHDADSRSSSFRIGPSRTQIVQTIQDFIFSGSRKEAGLAESTLRLILSQYKKHDPEVHGTLSQALIDALCRPSSLDQEDFRPIKPHDLHECSSPRYEKPFNFWIQDFVVALAQLGSEDPILSVLAHITLGISGFAEKVFPFVLHIVLLQQHDRNKTAKEILSNAFNIWFDKDSHAHLQHLRSLVTTLVYLRTQPVPREGTRLDRDHWLEIDFLRAAKASTNCGLHKTALLFLETYASPPIRASRRTSVASPAAIPTELQMTIYKQLDEPDSFYGIEQEPDITSILSRLEYEGNGMKSLLFRGARMDSQMRRLDVVSPLDSQGMIRSLTMINMHTVAQALLSSDQMRASDISGIDNVLETARKLEQWDIKAPDSVQTETSATYKAFQGLSVSNDAISGRKHLDTGFLQTMKRLLSGQDLVANRESGFRVLAVLTEIDDLLSASSKEELDEVCKTWESRTEWMKQGRIENIRPIISSRETLLGVLTRNEPLRESLKASPAQIYQVQTAVLMTSSKLSRKHGALQDALASTTLLNDIKDVAESTGIKVESLAMLETAGVLWDQGEGTTAIRLLQKLRQTKSLQQHLSREDTSRMFLQLGQYIAESRVGKPQEIIEEYLEPAIKELKADTKGHQAGEAFHTFAAFCDAQLSSTELNDEFARVEQRKQQKEEELEPFKALVDSLKNNQNEHFKARKEYSRMKKWYELDKQECERLRSSKEKFVALSLKNYLLSLRASDTYNNDVLRVFALWLEFSDTPQATEVMEEWLSKVPCGKFAVLMNQLSSRLQVEKSKFQEQLSDLVFQICKAHPYHGMHQIYAGAASSGVKDLEKATKSRVAAAKEMSQILRNDVKAKYPWKRIHDSNVMYHELALKDLKGKKEVALSELEVGKKMMAKLHTLKVPPATFPVELRASGDYDDLPVIISWKSKVSIACGLSAPKIATAIASNGQPYKQLFKSGNDDLRQDAIMEQVFEQASKLLKNHQATRLRNLQIRSYKVLPLSSTSGLMEFVKDTIPLSDAIFPAHRRYYPKDWKSDDCRNKISSVAGQSEENRVKMFRHVMDNFHPVLRFFFLERFENPDEWFEKRLAYTRTTAAISILGHVLGLGDRHCQNILLDQNSGEVVHIDLGVAFEAGRILPIPEVVPFRLTRDLVDAMGFTKTEGVFKRCCEFTLKTLREERESIMILLNVLRYDPLISWTVSANRAHRMQAQQEPAENGAREQDPEPETEVPQNSKKKDNDSRDAERALAVVEQKLSKSQSASAVVSGLIQQATDEHNLALLFHGWSAYA